MEASPYTNPTPDNIAYLEDRQAIFKQVNRDYDPYYQAILYDHEQALSHIRYLLNEATLARSPPAVTPSPKSTSFATNSQTTSPRSAGSAFAIELPSHVKRRHVKHIEHPEGLIPVNKFDQRLDGPIEAFPFAYASNQGEEIAHLCVSFALLGRCALYQNSGCPYTHVSVGPELRVIIQHKLRRSPCKEGNDCRDLDCHFGHACHAHQCKGPGSKGPMRRVCKIPKNMHFKDLDVAGWVSPSSSSPVRARTNTLTSEGTPTPSKASIAWRPEVKSVDIPKRGSKVRLGDGLERVSTGLQSRASTGDDSCENVFKPHVTPRLEATKMVAQPSATETGNSYHYHLSPQRPPGTSLVWRNPNTSSS